MPAFFGFVPPTTFVPRCLRQWRSVALSERVLVAAHTVLDGLLGMEAVALSAHARPARAALMALTSPAAP